MTETKIQILCDHVSHTRLHTVEMRCQMVQLLSAHIVEPTMCVNLTLALVFRKLLVGGGGGGGGLAPPHPFILQNCAQIWQKVFLSALARDRKTSIFVNQAMTVLTLEKSLNFPVYYSHSVFMLGISSISGLPCLGRTRLISATDDIYLHTLSRDQTKL